MFSRRMRSRILNSGSPILIPRAFASKLCGISSSSPLPFRGHLWHGDKHAGTGSEALATDSK